MAPPSIAKLNNSNYIEWVIGMRATLVRHGLWEVVESAKDETRPSGSDNTKAVRSWKTKRQEAQAEILLHVEPSQYAHVADEEDPHTVWESLKSVHQSRGFATRNAAYRAFMRMTKHDDKPMSAWIADVRRAAFNLRAIDANSVSDNDIITVLTGGLPDSYAPFVVTLDSTPADDLTLEYVTTRLLNEEARQSAYKTISDAAAYHVLQKTRSSKIPTPIERIVCHRCQTKGQWATTRAPAPRLSGFRATTRTSLRPPPPSSRTPALTTPGRFLASGDVRPFFARPLSRLRRYSLTYSR